MAAVETSLQPVELLTLLHEVETDFGRLRSAPNAPRTLDLDLLDYDGRVDDGARVMLPHPRMSQAQLCAGATWGDRPGLAASGERAGGGGTCWPTLADRDVPRCL